MAFLNESAFVAIGFALFVILVWKKAATAIGAMLDERTAKIKAELEEAQSLREEAAAELAKYQKLSREAADEAKQILVNAESTAARITEAAEAALVAELRAKSASLAVSAAQAVMTDKLDVDASLALVEESAKQIAATQK